MIRGRRWSRLLLGSAAALCAAGPAFAQAPLQLSLRTVGADPLEVTAEATGALPAGDVVRGCPGWVAEGPALVIEFQDAAMPPPRFDLTNPGDGAPVAGLIVAAPDGIYRCAPLGPEGRATVSIAPAQAGAYEVWPTVAEQGGTARARIAISGGELPAETVVSVEEPEQGSGGGVPGLQRAAPPSAGLHPLPEGGTIELDLTLAPVADAEEFVPACFGRIDPSRPDAVIRLEPGRDRLELRARSSTDTTLLVLGPDGAPHCADDTDGLDPLVALTPAPAGDYAVWVGTYEGGQTAEATLHAADAGQMAVSLQPDAAPAGGLHVLGEGAVVEVALDLAPTAPAAEFAAACSGRIDPARPDAVIRLESGRESLALRANSTTDTTLLVLGPDGVPQCADDTFDLDPEVTIGNAVAGDYAVWVGTFDDEESASATLTAGAESGAVANADALGTGAEPAGGTHALAGSEPLEVELSLAPTAEASDFGGECAGRIDPSRPDAVIRLESGHGRLELHADSSSDTTLLVLGPDGAVHCNDDGNGLDPVVEITPATEGDYAVWVGVYDEVEEAAATLHATVGEAVGDLQAAAPPAAGLHVLPEAGSVEMELTLAATASASEFAAECAGRIDPSRPDAVIRLEAHTDRLALGARSRSDTTMLVLGPDGVRHCADDTHGLDPEVAIEGAVAGDYAVWVGTYEFEENATATLTGAATAVGGTHVLAPDGELQVSVVLGPGFDEGFDGVVCEEKVRSRTPGTIVRVESARDLLQIRVRAAEDATLHVEAPDGKLVCNDDTYGLDPAVVMQPAPAGDYKIWVGSFDPNGGGTATVHVGGEIGPGGDSGGLFGPGMPNPFEGTTPASATEALEILMSGTALGESLEYSRIESGGTEGFTLHDVALTDPTAGGLRLEAGQLRVSGLDLAGLAASGAPDRFTITLQHLDYAEVAAVIEDAMSVLLPALPGLDARPALSATFSLQPPDGDLGRRVSAFSVELDGQFALGLEARLLWPEGTSSADMSGVPAEEIAFEIRNLGFLGALLRSQAEEAGVKPETLSAMLLDQITGTFPAVAPGDPRTQLLDAVSAALEAPDRPGVLRIRLVPTMPQGLEALANSLESPTLDDGISFEASFTPLP